MLFCTFGPPSLAFARTCARNGIEVCLLERTKDGTPSGYSSALHEREAIPDWMGHTNEALKTLASYCNKVSAQALIAVSEIDLLWLASNRGVFEPQVRLLAASEESLQRLQSKEEQIELARQAGFDVLQTWILKSVNDYRIVPQDQYPICVRPSNPADVSPTFKARVLHSSEELRTLLTDLTCFNGSIITQPFLKLPDLKVHGARATDGKILAMRPFFVERKFEGVTLTLRRGTFPSKLEETCRKFSELAGIEGCFHFDLLFDPENGKTYYLEVNVRMGGITDKAKAFGYDQTVFIFKCFGLGNRTWQTVEPTIRNRVVTKRSVIKHMITVITGKHSELDYPQVGRLRHLFLSCRDLVVARDSVFDLRDLKGTIWFNFQ